MNCFPLLPVLKPIQRDLVAMDDSVSDLALALLDGVYQWLGFFGNNKKENCIMNNFTNEIHKPLETKIRFRWGWMLILLFVLAAVILSAQPVQASGQCPAPGTGLPGALNMLHDATM